MNWYKTAKTDSYPMWLAQRLIKETDRYKHVKNQTYPGTTFESRDIKLVEDWVHQTNPDFEDLSLTEAIKKARIYYEQKRLPKQLNNKDVDMHNLHLAMIDGLNHMQFPLQIDEETVKINKIRSTYPDTSKMSQNVFNFVVIVEFNGTSFDRQGKILRQGKWFASLITKDGTYFSICEVKPEGTKGITI